MNIFNMPENTTAAPIPTLQQPQQPTTSNQSNIPVATIQPTSINPNGHSAHQSVQNNDANFDEVMRSIAVATLSGDESDSASLRNTYAQPQFRETTAPAQRVPSNTPVPNSQQQPPLTDPNTDDQSSRARNVVENFLRFNPTPDLLEGIDQAALAERIGNGDMNALTGALSQTANNATKAAMQSFLLMIPSITESIKADILRQVRSSNAEGEHWSSFVAAYPEFKSLRAAVEPQLLLAIKKNPTQSPDTIRRVIQTMYSGMVRATGLQPAPSVRNRRESGDAFSLADFLGT